MMVKVAYLVRDALFLPSRPTANGSGHNRYTRRCRRRRNGGSPQRLLTGLAGGSEAVEMWPGAGRSKMVVAFVGGLVFATWEVVS